MINYNHIYKRQMKKIAILSDTHSFIDNQIINLCNDCDEIWHGGDFGFRLNKSIALGMVKPNLAKVGQKLEIDILGKMHNVSIIEDSPYDPENKLLRT